MANTLTNTLLPRETWVDLYADTGLTVGVQIAIQNIGAGHVYLYSGASAPADKGDSFNILTEYEYFQNDAGDAGAWAYCENDGKINVKAV